MIGFKEFHQSIDEETEMEKKVKLLTKIDKHAEKLKAHAKTNFKINSTKFYDLVDKYDNMRESAINAGVWKLYCQHRKLHPEHTGRDYYA